jgi:hypothetical protein
MSDDKNDQPARDAKGRWQKGHCPNPKGRPRKQVMEDYNPSDLRDFSNSMIEVISGGQKVKMDRRAALLHKIYESAMKGSVTSQRFLFKEFERNTERLATMRILYDELMLKWVFMNPNYKGFDDLPFDIQLELIGLESILNHYFPGQYPSHGKPTFGPEEEA